MHSGYAKVCFFANWMVMPSGPVLPVACLLVSLYPPILFHLFQLQGGLPATRYQYLFFFWREETACGNTVRRLAETRAHFFAFAAVQIVKISSQRESQRWESRSWRIRQLRVHPWTAKTSVSLPKMTLLVNSLSRMVKPLKGRETGGSQFIPIEPGYDADDIDGSSNPNLLQMRLV